MARALPRRQEEIQASGEASGDDQRYTALRIRDDYEAMVDQALMQTLAALLKDHTEVQTAYLFGSRARGSHRPTSDVDIAVTFMPATSAWHEVELQEQLATQLALPVQVVDLARAGAHLVQAVAREGIPLIGKALVVEDDTSMDAERLA